MEGFFRVLSLMSRGGGKAESLDGSCPFGRPGRRLHASDRMVAVTIGQWLQKKFGMRVVDAKWTSPQQTETYDGGNLPPSYVFFVIGACVGGARKRFGPR